ncbi:hypothetical protein B6U80_01170 [Candidatus Pacearchaeota archaeon ex4484_26]|nr:MAG: hypothetical protein B6U80_01170 [Candidatus Pacearchaeota archaeon ex4484_26]RLG10823.1 MAG: hypothetical protein DRN69_08530 [Candidatus Pacearchaeota archaeon]
MKRKILGLIEPVYIKGKDEEGKAKELKIKAKIDTGAYKSSISKSLVKKLKLGPVKKTMIIKSALGKERRKVIKVQVRIKNKKLKAFFSIANRKHLTYDILIGQNILKLGKFLIDPLK